MRHYCKVHCKRTKHCWLTIPNVVGCYMLRPFAYPVACCCVLLGVVGQSWFETGQTFSYAQTDTTGAIHSTKISGNFGPKLNGSVRSNRKSFEKTGPPFEVDHFSRSDRSEILVEWIAPNSSQQCWDSLSAK